MPRTLLKPQRAWKQQVDGQRHAADALCIPQRLRPARPAIRPSPTHHRRPLTTCGRDRDSALAHLQYSTIENF